MDPADGVLRALIHFQIGGHVNKDNRSDLGNKSNRAYSMKCHDLLCEGYDRVTNEMQAGGLEEAGVIFFVFY